MNVFYLSECPETAARNQCDRHVVKMILESAQLLSTAHHLLGSGGPYKVTHQNHPSAVWARSSTGNYRWLWEHMAALGAEYTARYGKIHKTIREHADTLYSMPYGLTEGPHTAPPQCMPDDCKHSDTVTAYEQYYGQKALEWARAGRPMKWNGE